MHPNIERVEPKTLSITPITLDDIEELKELCCYSKESRPVMLDGNYIGNSNVFGELTLASNIDKEQFDKLFKEIPKSGEMYVGIDYGKGIDKTMVMQCTLNRQITNVHRIRKGKRHIIKFDYTGLTEFIGVSK